MDGEACCRRPRSSDSPPMPPPIIAILRGRSEDMLSSSRSCTYLKRSVPVHVFFELEQMEELVVAERFFVSVCEVPRDWKDSSFGC